MSTKKNKNLLFIALLITAVFGCSQKPSDSTTTKEAVADFNEALAIPFFNISTIDDSTGFNRQDLDTNGIILIKYFSPDCEHCQEEAHAFFSKKDSLQNIRTIWTSGDWAQLKMVREFAEKYQLEQLDPIAIGKETANDLVVHYGFSGVPFTAVYKDNQLIKEYRGDVDFRELIAINNGTYKPKQDIPDLQNEK